MYKVTQTFKDKYTMRYHKVGAEFVSDEPERIAFLLSQGAIEEVGVVLAPQPGGYDLMSKKELADILDGLGVTYTKRATKEELLALLEVAEHAEQS